MVESVFRSLQQDRASGRVTTLRDWLAGRAMAPERFRETLAGIPEKLRGGIPFTVAVKDFLDEFSFRPHEIRQGAIDERPDLIGVVHQDAFLGAVAEHLAGVHALTCPAWAAEPQRFSERFWFSSDVKGFRALLIATSPAAFRRRGLFVSPRALSRV
ncbi:MAG TPA: hypothetical protein VGB64_01395 [Actinomycetota bacterium]